MSFKQPLWIDMPSGSIAALDWQKLRGRLMLAASGAIIVAICIFL